MTGLWASWFRSKEAELENKAHRKIIHDNRGEAQKAVAANRNIRKKAENAEKHLDEISRVAECAIKLLETEIRKR